jgi:membrane-bound metal-dependent hydrolase YbcI (DUF457 family)
VNGRSHVVIGLAAPSFLVTAGADLGQLAVLGILSAGAALGPDIDHPNATATKALGGVVHKSVHTLSKTVRLATSTRSDRAAHRQWEGLGRDADHRALTHTGISALVIGVGAFAAALVPFGETAMAALVGWTAGHLMGRKAAPVVSLGSAAVAFLVGVPAWMAAVAVCIGWLSHVLADACTMGGVPLTWPMRKQGRRWRHTRLMGRMLRSGGGGEWVVTVAAVAVLVLPFAATFLATH